MVAKVLQQLGDQQLELSRRQAVHGLRLAFQSFGQSRARDKEFGRDIDDDLRRGEGDLVGEVINLTRGMPRPYVGWSPECGQNLATVSEVTLDGALGDSQPVSWRRSSASASLPTSLLISLYTHGTTCRFGKPRSSFEAAIDDGSPRQQSGADLVSYLFHGFRVFG